MNDRYIFDQRGSTWTCSFRDRQVWPLILIARRVYYGTGRVLSTMSLARYVEGNQPVLILTEHLDLLIGRRRQGFSKEAARRLGMSNDGSTESYEAAIAGMLDATLERLMLAQDEIDIISADDITISTDLTPPYTLWPLVPTSRPGMLVSPSGQGKSNLAAMLGLSTVTGKVFLPRFEPRIQGPVLYIGQEENKEQWAARLEMMCRGHGLQRPKHYWYLKLKGASLIESAEILAEQAASRHAAMVIIDSAQATWGSGDDAVREYASRWYNAVEMLNVPTLIIEHPSRIDSGRGNGNGAELFAAGTSVKRDRVGHAWSLKSVAMPAREDHPTRYHVTLTDEKRNYVARQPDITYAVEINGFKSMRFAEAEGMSAMTIVESGSRMDDAIASIMRTPDETHVDDGYTVTELAERLKQKDDRRVRDAMKAEYWRPANWQNGVQYRFAQVEGSGTNRVTNPARFQLDLVEADREVLELSTSPGDPGLQN